LADRRATPELVGQRVAAAIPTPRPAARRLPPAALLLVGAVALLVLAGRRLGYGLAEYAQLLVDGLATGSVYALVALGFVVVYRVSGVINFAQGAFVMLGPMLCISLLGPLPDTAAGLLLAALVATAACAASGALLHRLALHPLRDAAPLARIIVTVGAYVSIQGIALKVWGPRPYVLPAFTTLSMADRLVDVGGVVVQAQSLWVWGTALVTFAALGAFFEGTVAGKAMRACAVNRTAARLVGIQVDRMGTLAFALAATLGAVGGIVLAPSTRPTFDMGLELGLKGFVASIPGGLVSFPGAVAGGIALGVLESLWAGVVLAGFKDLFAFAMLVILLLTFPRSRAASEESA
jgi:branched-chain amino acid transport system permease protein